MNLFDRDKMEVLELQIIFIVSIFFGTFLCSILPLVALRKRTDVAFSSSSQNILSCLSCVAGGVFIAMCFLGLVPFVQEKFSLVFQEANFQTEFPVAECVVVLGFFFILTVEQLCMLCRKKRSGVVATEIELKSTEDVDAIRKLLDAEEFDGGDQDVLFELNSQHGNPVVVRNKEPMRNGSATSPDAPRKQTTHGDHSCNTVGHSHLTGLMGQKLSLRFFILLLALSIHALFEGMALGLQTESNKALHLFIAITLHECLCAFALGVNTTKLRLSLCAGIRYVIFFCLTIPLGIGIGIVVGKTPGLIGNIISGVLQGLAAGIFMHVTFMEIIPAEFANGQNGLLKVLFFFIGFLILTAINIAQELQRL